MKKINALLLVSTVFLLIPGPVDASWPRRFCQRAFNLPPRKLITTPSGQKLWQIPYTKVIEASGRNLPPRGQRNWLENLFAEDRAMLGYTFRDAETGQAVGPLGSVRMGLASVNSSGRSQPYSPGSPPAELAGMDEMIKAQDDLPEEDRAAYIDLANTFFSLSLSRYVAVDSLGAAEKATTALSEFLRNPSSVMQVPSGNVLNKALSFILHEAFKGTDSRASIMSPVVDSSLTLHILLLDILRFDRRLEIMGRFTPDDAAFMKELLNSNRLRFVGRPEIVAVIDTWKNYDWVKAVSDLTYPFPKKPQGPTTSDRQLAIYDFVKRMNAIIAELTSTPM